MDSEHPKRLERVRCSVEGLSVGDSLGEQWFFKRRDVAAFEPIQDRTLPLPPWEYTDDTQMALAIAETLKLHGGIDQNALAESFATRFDPKRGYGPAMYDLLPRLAGGESWQQATPKLFRGQGSFGNGGAMRVAPVGAYFADDLAAAAEHGRRSCEVTHTHPEAIAGAIAVAVAAAVAWQAKRQQIRPTRQDFIKQVAALVPPSEVLNGLHTACELPDGTAIWEVVYALGNGSGISAQDTVPFTLWCAGERLDYYEEAIWLTLSGSGDIDTNCAIVGGIVVMYTGPEAIPPQWWVNRERLPSWPFVEAN